MNFSEFQDIKRKKEEEEEDEQEEEGRGIDRWREERKKGG